MLDKTELENLKYDPVGIQHTLLEYIDTNTNITIPDVTSPFMMLLESNAILTTNALDEMMRIHRKTFPELALTKEDLWSHMHDYDYINVFSTPAEARIIFLLNVNDILANGVDRTEYKEVTIPATSVITVRDTVPFTLLNDIVIKLYNNKTVSIEQQLTNLVSENIPIGLNPISITDIGVIDGHIILDTEGIEYIAFETRVKQIRRAVIEDIIIAGVGYKKEIILEEGDRYYWTEIYIQTDNGWKLLDITHSDIVYDSNKPTVWVRNLDNRVVYELPTVYTETLTGNIRLVIYTTKGKVDIPLDKYSISDFKMDLEDTGKSPSSSVSPFINILNKSIVPCIGGSNGKSMEEIRDLVISDSIGNFKLPITEKQLIEDVKNLGYSLEKAHDVTTNRVYIASRFMMSDTRVKSKLTPITIKYLLRGDVTTNKVKHFEDYNCSVIYDNTIFRYDNGVISVLTDKEYNELTVLTNKSRLPITLSKKRYFYTPFHYVVNYGKDIIDSRVYMLNNPKLINLRITSKNTELEEKVNSNSYSIKKIETGYKLQFSIKGNKEFNQLPTSTIFGQLKLMINDVPIYFKGVCDSNRVITFNIDTNFVITEEDTIVILNGISDIKDKAIKLTEEMELLIYTTSSLVKKTFYKYNYYVKVDVGVEVFSVENIKIELGYRVNYIWNRVLSNYSERVPKTYASNIPATYKEDIYKIFPETNSIFKVENDKLVYEKLHNKGEIVVDDNGNPVYEHQIGDNIVDDNGLPILDKDSTVIRTMDIVAIEYEYLVADNLEYIDYYSRCMGLMESWLRNDMDRLNDLTLDNTSILFKPHKSIEPISIKINDYTKTVSHTVIPEVTIYVTKSLDMEQEELEDIVGDVIDTYLENSKIQVSILRELIIGRLGSSVVGVKIKKLTDIEDLEAFTIVSNNRINIRKKIERDSDGTMVVRYNVIVNTVEV